MRSKALSKRILLITSIAGLTLSLSLFTYLLTSFFIQQNADLFASEQVRHNMALLAENIATLSKQKPVVYFGLPVHLLIPKINIDASVVSVGVTSDGAIDAKDSQDDVSWFNLGQRPGNVGVAVISGHYGMRNNKSSVFDNLHKLQKGDELYVEDDKGALVSFVVRDIQRYNPSSDAKTVFESKDGKAHLNLITCEGLWNDVSGAYPKRLVVFADKK